MRLRTALLVASAAMLLVAPSSAHADVAVSISGPTLTVTAIADSGDPSPQVELVSAGGDDYEIRYNTNVGMTVSEDADRCSDGGSAVSEVQCERDDLTDIVLNADPTADTEFLMPFTDDDDVVFNGGDGDDFLDAGVNGMANADLLNGGAGIDDLEAGAGIDTMNGGDDDDDLDGGGDGDPVNGDAGRAALGGGAGADVVSGGLDNDTNVHGDAGADTVNGNDGTDTLNGDADGDVLNGGIGGDTLRGDAGNDTLNGDAGNDTLEGGQNAAAPQDTDTLNGGDDNDLLRNSEGPDDFNGGTSTATGDEVDYQLTAGTQGITADNDDVVGDDGRFGEGDSIDDDVENLTGDDGVDVLTGNTQPNDIDGQESNDTLSGGAGTGPDGADVLIGGAGDDDASYDSRSDDLDLDIGGGADDGAACPGAGCEGDDIRADIEDIAGGAGDDDITGDVDDNDLAGGPGDDEIAGGAEAGGGADGGDELIGGLHGTVGGQNSSLGDTATYAARTDAIFADIGGGDDDGAGCAPPATGCELDDVRTDIENLTGGTAGDTLSGDGDPNRLLGQDGSDTLAGGQQAGPDGADVFGGGSDGSDTVTYSARTDGITASLATAAGPEGDSLGSAIDNLTGGSGPDVLTGGVSANVLNGLGGDDLLRGGTGVGPDGADTFFAGPSAGDDTVTYSNRTDDLDLDLDGAADDGATGELDDISSAFDNLIGGDGDDDLNGDGKANTLDGRGGDDDLVSGTTTGPDGADVYIGGTSGTAAGQNIARGDRAFFSARTDDLQYDIGGGADDSDGDDVRPDVENLTGGAGSDVLVGDGVANILDGRESADVLAGGAGTGPDGADDFFGGTGLDTVTYATRTDGLTVDLTAGTGPDGDDLTSARENVIGGSGNDTLTGTATENVLTGGFGADDLDALGGADRVEARDGVVDTIDCGTEGDIAITDSSPPDDTIGCETLDSAPFTPPQPPPPGGGGGAPAPAPAGDTAAPETTITAGPKPKTKTKTASFVFSSSEPGSSFQCSLDDGPFEPCTSPEDVKVKKGKHTFEVRATDAAGNTDPAPATRAWTVKKKKK